MSLPPSGWYPQSNGELRYWDGHAWTDQTAPAPRTLDASASGWAQHNYPPADYSTPTSTPGRSAVNQRPSYAVPTARPQKGWLLVIGFLVLIFVVLPIIGLLVFLATGLHSVTESSSSTANSSSIAMPSSQPSVSGRTAYLDGYAIKVGQVTCNLTNKDAGSTAPVALNGGYCKATLTITQVESDATMPLDLSSTTLADANSIWAQTTIDGNDQIAANSVIKVPAAGLTGNLWFDAPLTTKPTAIEFSGMSGSVQVPLK